MLTARDNVETTREVIKRKVETLNKSHHLIDSARRVVDLINEPTQVRVTQRLVSSVMREELGMRFRKIKTVSLHSNSEKNLVLR